MRDLKEDISASGGNLAPEQLKRIVRSHEPLAAIHNNLISSLGIRARRGTHERPLDNRVQALLERLCKVDPFTYTRGRFFRGHPTMPRELSHWLVPAEFTTWVEKKITALGNRQETGVTMRPSVTFHEFTDHELRHAAEAYMAIHNIVAFTPTELAKLHRSTILRLLLSRFPMLTSQQMRTLLNKHPHQGRHFEPTDPQRALRWWS